jgi:hypothetical protein
VVYEDLQEVDADLAVEPILRQLTMVNVKSPTAKETAFIVHHERQARSEYLVSLAKAVFIENVPFKPLPKNKLQKLLKLITRYDNEFIAAFENLKPGRRVRDSSVQPRLGFDPISISNRCWVEIEKFLDIHVGHVQSSYQGAKRTAVLAEILQDCDHVCVGDL